MAVLDSQSGYKTTMNEEQNVQIIPITTQATKKKTRESQPEYRHRSRDRHVTCLKVLPRRRRLKRRKVEAE